ncbi:MAG: phosphoglycerate dehydrogenase [Thermomicrobiales bacterium]|nr:phosphoglycerate dehydrogenase [Thermomicrobiales bacterium]
MTTQSAHPAFRIAIDMDGVLTESPVPLARAANAEFGLDLPDLAFVDSSGLNVPLAVREWVYRGDGPASKLHPAHGAQQFINDLIGLVGQENVLIVTARPENSAEMTIRWFHEHGFASVQIIFADDKTAIASRQGCKFAVEDSLRHARNYSAGDVTCYLINNVEQLPADANPLMVTVNSFDEIVRRLSIATQPVSPSAVIDALPPMETTSPSERWRIVVADQIHKVAREQLEAVATIVDVDGTDVNALLGVLHDADALVVRSETQVTQQVLDAAPRLKVIARAGVGVDNIDVAASTRAGVIVLNAPGANATSAGEHTIALLLAVTRQIPFANATTHAGEWKRKQIKPIDLRGRTLGMIGIGRVGSVVAKRLKAFEMQVIAYDPYLPRQRFADMGVEQVELEDIWTRSDIVTFHSPSTTETHHILNAETLAKMKPGAIVINAGRGELVDEFALADALKSGHISGAGVDVFPFEPCTESPLFGLPNVVLTPHTGGSSAEALEAVGRVIGATTIAALNGEAVPNAVNLPAASLESRALKLLTQVSSAAGHLCAVIMPEHPRSFSVQATGMVSNDLTEHVCNSALAAALQTWLGRRVTPVNARLIAQEMGMSIQTSADDGDETIIPRFRFEIEGVSKHSVVVSWDRDIAGIVEVDRFGLQQPLSGYVLITHHTDKPGIIGALSTTLASYNINIAGMQVSRTAPRGEAMMVTNVDEEIPEDALNVIRRIDGMENAVIVSLPNMLEDEDPVHVANMITNGIRGR